MVRFLDLYHSHEQLIDQIEAAFRDVVTSSSFIGGKRIELFENSFADFVGGGHCVGVGNGTDAIEIAIEALDPDRGGEIIVPANTFIATSEAVTRMGYQVVFADVSSSSYNLDPVDVARRITSKTVGIIAVHLYGNPAELVSLRALCDEHSLFLIEDCAQAHGASYQHRHVGNVGDVSTFSFYPGKNLGALGDAGAIVTSDAAIAARCRAIANHGRSSKYDHFAEGRNSRLDGVQAAMLSVKLPYLDGWVGRRREVADLYNTGLRDAGVALPPANAEGQHAYHLYVIRSENRDALAEYLRDRRVETGIHYPVALPSLTAYRNHPQHGHPFFAVAAAGEILSLPMGPHLSDADVHEVIEAVIDYQQSR